MAELPSGTVDVPVHRSRGFDRAVGGASRRDAWRLARHDELVTTAGRGPRWVRGQVDGRRVPRRLRQRARGGRCGDRCAAHAGRRIVARDRPAAGAHGRAHGRRGAARPRLPRSGAEPGGPVDVGGPRRPDPGVARHQRAHPRRRRRPPGSRLAPAPRSGRARAGLPGAPSRPGVGVRPARVPVAVPRQPPVEPAGAARPVRRSGRRARATSSSGSRTRACSRCSVPAAPARPAWRCRWRPTSDPTSTTGCTSSA